MIDANRQLPATSASGWIIDLVAVEGPRFVVLRRDEGEARVALAAHLVEIGSLSNTIEAERIVAAAPIESVGVVW